MNKKTIGIPKGFLYYRYHILWKIYFNKLGYKVIESPNTTKEIIELGNMYSIDESCLSSKIYMGHIAALKDKCDYILVPRIDNYGKNEKVCVKFNATYDLAKSIINSDKILDYNIENTKHHYESIGLIKIGLKLNKNLYKVLKSYYYAKKKEKEYNKEIEIEQIKLLENNNKKILIVSHPYNIYDNYIGSPIINKLSSSGIDIIYADRLNKKIAKTYARALSPTLYWTYSKELIGAVNYYQNVVDGILLISSFPCGPDSLVNELVIRKIKKIPVINIVIDELFQNVGLETRLESFIDIIKERKENHE